MDIGNAIRTARKDKGLTAAEAGALINVTQATFSRIERGEVSVDAYRLAEIAQALDVPISRLLGIQSQTLVDVQYVPVVASASAGQLTEAILADAEIKIPVTHPSKTLVAVEVVGTSLNKIIPEGAYAVIDYEDRALVSKQCYAIQIDGEVTLKRFSDAQGIMRFEPVSTETHDTIFCTQPIEVIGRIVAFVGAL